MAAKYRKIDPRIWNDEKFQKLTTFQKLVALEILTGQSNRIGFFRLSCGLIAEHVYPSSKLASYQQRSSCSAAAVQVTSSLGWLYDQQTSSLLIPTWWKYNPPESPKALLGRLKDLHDVPTSPLHEQFWIALRKGFPKSIDWLPKDYRYQEQEQDD